MTNTLKESIKAGLIEAEKNGSIVISTTTISDSIDIVSRYVEFSTLENYISLPEMHQLAWLIFHAVNDERFFDWEMPILIGATKEEIKIIWDKLNNTIDSITQQEATLKTYRNSNT